jgi:hypothetical protein
MKKFTLNDKQMLLRDAIRRMDPLHQHWKILEGLYRTGMRRDLNAKDFADLTPTPIPGNILKTINYILPHISLMVTSIVSRDPQMLVIPIGGKDNTAEDNATFAQAVLQYFWKRTNATDDVKSATEDMIKLGNGFCKVGWDYVANEYKESPSDLTMDEALMKVDQAEAINKDGGFAPETSDLSAKNKAQSTYELVESDDPFVEYVSPYDMFVSRDARRLDSARWVCQRLRLPYEDVREKYGEDVNLSVDATIASDSLVSTYLNGQTTLPEVLSYVVLYEFYDLLTRELTVFQIDSSEPLFEGPIPYQNRYSPFVHFRNYNDGGMQFWSFGDLENIAGIQLMLGEVTRAQIDDLKRSGNKYAVRKRHMTPELKKQLESPIPDQVVVFDIPEASSLDDVVRPLSRQATPSDAYAMDGKLQDAMMQVLGINDFQAGGVGADRMSATAAAVVDGVATLRAQDKLAALETAISGIGLRVLLLCQEFLDEQRAVRIAGPNGSMWLNVSPSDIYGEFKVSVEGGSTRALNPATRAQRGIQTLQAVIPALTQLGYDPTNALRMAIKDLGYDPNFMLVPAQQPEELPVDQQVPQEVPMVEQPPMEQPSLEQQNMTLDELMAGMNPNAGLAPAQAIAEEFGGPGVIGASNGGLQL